MPKFSSSSILLCVAVVACADETTMPAPNPTVSPIQSVEPRLEADASGFIPGQYIVVFKDQVADPDALSGDLGRAHGFSTIYRYKTALKGFLAQLPPAAVEALRHNPNVAYVEQDKAAQIDFQYATQTNATWGLDRIDQRNLPLSSTYAYSDTANSIKIYILDSGVRFSHRDFTIRPFFLWDAFGGNGSDCFGHGTHVAGTAASQTYGVAKRARIWVVRVVDCAGGGSAGLVAAGVDTVTAHRNRSGGPAVANMSIRIVPPSLAVDDAVRRSISSGITYTVS